MTHPYHQHAPPYPWFPPYPYPHHQQQPQIVPDIIVPARVNKALEFLGMMTRKTTKQAVGATCDIAIELEIIDGQELTTEEANTVATACNLLSKYFAGKLNPDIWEQVKVDGARKQVDTGGLPGRLLNCIACSPNPPNAKCPFCHGTGKIMVTPVGSNHPPGDEPPDETGDESVDQDED